MQKRQKIVFLCVQNIAKFAKKHGISFLEASVGDRYVLELIERDGLSLGGEQSGHIIIREAATTGDGQLTAIYLLNRMIETKCSAEELASVITKYPQSTVNIPATAADKEAIKNSSEVENIISGARERLRDRGRILVRPSGTEPLVRITVESDSEELTASVCNDVACKIKDFITKK